jgi:hypothetical protein
VKTTTIRRLAEVLTYLPEARLFRVHPIDPEGPKHLIAAGADPDRHDAELSADQRTAADGPTPALSLVAGERVAATDLKRLR